MIQRHPPALAVVIAFALCAGSPAWADGEVFSDNFDSGNVVNTAPSGWTANKAASADDRMQVVDKATMEPFSPPFCVELADDSGPGQGGNPFITRSFDPIPDGRFTCRIQIPVTAAAPAIVELWHRGASGSQAVFRVTFESNGRLSYREGTADSSEKGQPTEIRWTPGQWQSLELRWTGDNKVTGTLDDVPFAEDVPAENGPPSGIKIRAGGDSISGQKAYIDDVVVQQGMD